VSPWRPLPGRGDKPDPRRVGDSLDAISRRWGAPKAGALAAVFDRWDEIVGAQVAAHTRPIRLSAGALVVAVDEPGWATQLRFLEADLLRRCNEVAGPGSVAKIDVRVGRR
jgi:predicted nucleic acid-binding Zn ribbon protein